VAERILAIDPGTTQSAWLLLDRQGMPEAFGIEANDRIKGLFVGHYADHLAIEMIASYGMPVGKEVFETCVWIGRFIAEWDKPYTLIYRNDVKMHLCFQTKGVNDSVIRQALMDRFGPGKAAIGTKKAPGPLYGISKDVWSALAIAVTWQDKQKPTLTEALRLAHEDSGVMQSMLPGEQA
jgi:hypothetical protein